MSTRPCAGELRTGIEGLDAADNLAVELHFLAIALEATMGTRVMAMARLASRE